MCIDLEGGCKRGFFFFLQQGFVLPSLFLLDIPLLSSKVSSWQTFLYLWYNLKTGLPSAEVTLQRRMRREQKEPLPRKKNCPGVNSAMTFSGRRESTKTSPADESRGWRGRGEVLTRMVQMWDAARSSSLPSWRRGKHLQVRIRVPMAAGVPVPLEALSHCPVPPIFNGVIVPLKKSKMASVPKLNHFNIVLQASVIEVAVYIEHRPVEGFPTSSLGTSLHHSRCSPHPAPVFCLECKFSSS